jgi:hypothetical protein
MSNIVAAAIGTQRQFTKQPVATYEKRLRQVNASNGIVNNGAGERLYRALTGLGDSLMRYAVGEEDRARANTVRVDKLINAATEEDWKKLSAIELLNKYGEFQLSDNPYAVAAIEQARGKYMSEKFNQQYSILQADQPVLTAKEETDRYAQEKNKFLNENQGSSFNVEQFYKGFWSSNPTDMNNLANQKVAEQSKTLMSIRDQSIEADFSTYVLQNSEKSPEEFLGGLQQLINGSILMNYPIERRKEALKAVVHDVATEIGNPELIRQMMNLTFTNDKDGKNPMTLGSQMSFLPYIQMAEQTELARPSEQTLKYQEQMIRAKSVAELDNWYNSLSESDRHMLKAAYAKTRASLITKELEEQNRMVRQNAQRITANQNQGAAHIGFLRYIQGGIDNTIRGISAADAYNEVVGYLNSDDFAKIKGTAEGTAMFAKALMWAPNTEMQKEYKAGFLSALMNATPQEMADPNNFQSITNARSLWSNNPGRFQTLFGADLTKEMQHLQALVDFTGNEVEGYKIFCAGRETKGKEPQMYAEYQNSAKNLVSSTNTFSLYNADTDNDFVEMSYSDSVIREGVVAAVTDLQASGLDGEGALNTVGAKLKDNYVAYNDNILPKVMFAELDRDMDGYTVKNGIDATSSGVYGAATSYMDHKIELANAAYPGTAWNWKWHNGKVLFYDMKSNMCEDPKDLDTFYDEVNGWWASRDEESIEGATKEPNEETPNVVGKGRAIIDDWHWDGR